MKVNIYSFLRILGLTLDFFLPSLPFLQVPQTSSTFLSFSFVSRFVEASVEIINDKSDCLRGANLSA